jgi:site-specific recombinase XerD
MEKLASVIAEFLQAKRKNLSPNTQRVYTFALQKLEWYMREVLRQTTTDCLTERNLLKFAAWTAEQPKGNVPNIMKAENGYVVEALTAGGVHVRLRPVRTFAIWCYRQRIVPENLFATQQFCREFFPRVPEKTLPVVRATDFNRLLRAAGQTRQPLRDQAILTLLYATGMRASDLCGLTIKDLEQPNVVHIRASKGGKDRYVPVGREVKSKVYQYIRHERPPSDSERVFLAGTGVEVQPMGRSSLLQLITRLCRVAEVEHMTPHAFRRGFVTALDRQGVARTVTQAVLGHTTTHMTDRYSRLNLEDLTEVLQAASPVRLAKGQRE